MWTAKGFSKYTKGLQRPFDAKFTADMQATALFLCENIDGAHFAYTQSDEISVIISDLAGSNSQQWFGGQVQKIVSTSAALATAKFNRLRPEVENLAFFDGRTHHLNGPGGVLEYLQWRQADAMKNSVGMLASHHFSHRALTGAANARMPSRACRSSRSFAATCRRSPGPRPRRPGGSGR